MTELNQNSTPKQCSPNVCFHSDTGFYHLGMRALFKMDFLAAIANFERGVKEHSEQDLASYWLGQCYFLEDDYIKVIEIYQNLIIKHPDWIYVQFMLGRAYAHCDRIEEAIECCEQVLEKGGNYPFVYLTLAKLYEKNSRKILKAIELVKKGVGLFPNHHGLKDFHSYLTDVDAP
ncbi:MAG: tetratricopeptide repeat protein [Oligoflexia bacterium]|nr:tetratricopeptide repeat protein [Oligoflexia bacterium]